MPSFFFTFSNSLTTFVMFKVTKYNTDHLVHHGPVKLRVAYQLLLLTELVNETLPEVSFPFLILHGDKDGLCDIAGSRQLYEVAKSADKSLKVRTPGI